MEGIEVGGRGMKPYAFGKSDLSDSENQEKAQGCPVRAVRSKNGPLHVFRNISRYNVPSRAVSVQNIGIAPGRRRNTQGAIGTEHTVGMSSKKTTKEGIEMKSIEASISTARIPTGMMTGWSHVRI